MPKKQNPLPGAPVVADQLPLTAAEIIQDYRLAYRSRQASLIGRREVLSGKAKFGIFGDGKEVPNLAMARAFRKGDFRSGYYRDQTFMFALGIITIEQFFAQLYAHTDIEADPSSGGRQMNSCFATRSQESDGTWKDLTAQYNSSADVAPTGSQMPRLVGLAYASKLYRDLEELQGLTRFSHNGDEVAFGTIGNASVAEGLFWESVNAIGVLRCPAVITIYDDGYGISVSNVHQVAKEDIGELLQGFRRPPGECCDGFDLYSVKGWDYLALLEAYKDAAEVARTEHMPSIIHVTELTQPQGHSTSGSHERYKSKERLEWEAEHDCLKQMRDWMVMSEITNLEELQQFEQEDQKEVEDARKRAWEAYTNPILNDRSQAVQLIDAIAEQSPGVVSQLSQIKSRLMAVPILYRRDIMAAVRDTLIEVRDQPSEARTRLAEWRTAQDELAYDRFSSYLYIEPSESGSALSVPEVKPVYSEASPSLMGFEILNAGFEAILARDPRVLAFGEDLGRLGDVNQAFRGLQEKFGGQRVADTGIREATILGQAIGLALRGLRPIAEIQYLDYLLYALQIMSDDLATTHWRTKGGQRAPVIVRTRGHRLEGIWHSGSPMAGILNLTRGMYLLVPRNMTQAVGFYNTLLLAEEPGLIIEVLNGYRIKERKPDNLADFTVPLGIPEVLRQGRDLTIVTYGPCVRVVLEAAELLDKTGIQAEVIDVQSLLPFDRPGVIGESLKKTSRVIFVDEDVPGGASAYMLQQVVEHQGSYFHLDSPPITISGTAHRPSYGSDGDYWSKPNPEQVFNEAYKMMGEVNPNKFPSIY